MKPKRFLICLVTALLFTCLSTQYASAQVFPQNVGEIGNNMVNLPSVTIPSANMYKFNGKELNPSVGLYDYGARYMAPVLGRFTTMDPLAEMNYSVSPYAYANNNPVNNIDPTGMIVRPAGNAELTMIQNTLPMDARSYVKMNGYGNIDVYLLNKYKGSDLNVNNLKAIVNSDRTMEVKLDDKFFYLGPGDTNNIGIGVAKMSYIEPDPFMAGTGISDLSTGESGLSGKTLFPDNDGLQNSTNNNIQVIINKNLSPEGAAETFSHEANGHGLLYIENGGDHDGASHQTDNVLNRQMETNSVLKQMIIDSKKETIKNMNGQ